jgi:hypothetical protein
MKMHELTTKLIKKTGSVKDAENHIAELFNHMSDDERFVIEGEDLDGMVCALIKASGEKRTFELIFES